VSSIANRRYLYAVLILAAIADFLQNLREAWVSTQGAIPLDHVVWRYAAPTTGIFILIVVLLAWSGDRWVQLVGLVSLLVITLLAFSLWHIDLLGGEATRPPPT
jgi:hypothetical protein